MMNCQDCRDDIDLYALGTLAPDETERVRTHVRSCQTCAGLLALAEGTAAAIAGSAPRVRAPATLRASVLDAIRRDVPAPTPAARPAEPARRNWAWVRPRVAGIAAAVTLVPLAGLLIWAALLQRQVNDLRANTEQIERRNDGLLLFSVPSSIKGDFRPVADAQGATGAVTWNPDRNACYVVFDHLPRPDAGSTYRLWYIVDDGQRVVDAGNLAIDADGRADLAIDTSRWRGQTYQLVLKREQRPHDPDAPALLVGTLTRQ